MNRLMKKVLALVLSLTMVVTICPQIQIIDVSAEEDNTPYCISQGRPVYVSSGKNEEYVVDGDFTTRWESGYDDTVEWLYVDLGKTADIDSLYIEWENAYAKSYKIQLSDDEENWRDVYVTGDVSEPEETNPDETAQGPSEIKIKAGTIKEESNGTISSTLSWDKVDGAVTYKIFVDDEDTVATAPDGFTFDKENRLDLINTVALKDGIHTYIVVAYGTDGEIARGTIEINSEEQPTTEEATTAEDVSGSGEPVQDIKKQTIDLTKYVENKEDRQARYVRIYMTEKELPAYGYSIYEFQVYGTNGVVKRPADYGTNLALSQPVECSGTRDEWWMYDEDGVMKPSAAAEVQASNAVDGKSNTSFTSYQSVNQWLYVDLGQEYTIGRITIDWNSDAGKIYDVQVSSDAENWETVYRVLRGYAYRKDNFTLYKQNVRYVRVYGYTQVESGSGFGIYELAVYEYKEGDSQENPEIQELPERQIINNANGEGSYVTGEMYNEKNKLPTFINEENIQTPIDSNSWWSSAMVQKYSSLLCVTPLKASFSTKGLGILTATSGWVGTRTENDLGTDQSSETGIDFYLSTDNFDTSSGYDRVENYGDYSVELGLMDDNGLQMKTTLVKGSPYIYNEFCDNTTVFISSTTITELYDGNGNTILANIGDTITTDHIAFKSYDEENTKAGNDGAYYCINVPEGTTFKAMVAGANYKIKITFPSAAENYMSIVAMTDLTKIDEYYQHGYAFVTDTQVDYTYNKENSKIVTTYDVTTKVMRQGFSNVTMQALFPHQWKHSDDADDPAAVYTSVRGDMKAVWSNSFTTTQQFAGLLPTFATPDSDMFDTEEMIEYLNAVVASKVNTAPVDDAYWEGKNVHPLAISVIMADQLGETEIKERLLAKLKSIMVDWFNYDGDGDTCYLIYNKDWGTVYYPNSAYGANAAICDHHFTYGYFMFGAAVLATYDKQFYNDYKDMVEILVRDYADPMEPEDDGNMFCKFRAFDQYAGHSWAGGYGDSDSGNNQESASEALFSWVGMYLWGEATQNQTYIDAGAYGFTTEMDAVEQYWFDYDETNWLPEYPFQAAGQIYGASMGYGTYFGGQPTYVYGIQWLPISEYLTNYGMNQEKCAKIYQGLEDDTAYAIAIEKRLGNIVDDDEYVTPDNGWQHITWPFLSQTDPERAYEKFEANVSSVQTEDRANTLWFIAAMDQLGYRTNDYVITGNITGSVYVKDTKDEDGNVTARKYTAEVWNPTETTQTVNILDADGTIVGTANIGARATVSFNIDTENNFELTQVDTPAIKATSLADGTATENVTGTVTFEDTQFVELSCIDSEATIYYTTDGSVPTTESEVYSGKILVSSNTTVKAIAVKDGCINSAYASTDIVINGDTVESSENLALSKTATASTENGADTASKAVDGNGTTRWQANNETAADDDYIQVDLGSVQAVNTVKINWEAAYASKYEIQVSEDGENWTTVATEAGEVGVVTTTFAATNARYVRMQGLKRGTQYGYSIYEFEVYGALQAKAPAITPVSGIYDTAQTVTMETTVKGAEIKYTLDGSEPTENSPTYIDPIVVDKSTVVKAVTYRKGMVLSEITEASIIISGTLTLNMTETSVAIDRTVQLSAITDDTVTWTSDNKAVATVDENGLITGVSEGAATITATIGNGQTASCTVTVTQPIHIESIELPLTKEIQVHTSETLEAMILPANTTDDKTITWESSDENVATVNASGTVTAKGIGEAVITATIGNIQSQCTVTVTPVSYEEMVASNQYNLSLNKTVIISSKYAGEGSQDEATLVNGDLTDSYVSTDWDNSRTSDYILFDLGANYTSDGLNQILLQFVNNSTFCESYEVQYSSNNVEYVTVAEVTDAAYDDTDDGLFIINVTNASEKIENTRYVKIIMNGHKNWGYQIREAAVLSTEQDAQIVEVEHCDNPEDLTVSSDNICEITYTITAGEGQTGYKYMVYLDGSKVGDSVDAGTYTLENVAKGTHIVQVVSSYDGKTSEGITKEVYVDDGSLKDFIDTDRNIAKGCDVTLDSIYESEGNQNPATLVDGIISGGLDSVVESQWGTKDATITLDLGKIYDKDSIEEVILAFKSADTFCSDYTIQFSSDNSNYETVYTAEGLTFKELFEDKVDTSNYSQDTVRYVRINLSGSNYTYGYQMYETAVIAKEGVVGKEPEDTIKISGDVKIEGHQISTSLGGNRVVGSVEPEIDGKTVENWGFIYGLASANGNDYGIVDSDLYVGSNNLYVKSYQSTSLGTIDTVMGDSDTATYFVRTMLFAAETAAAFSAEYKVRAYAVLSDGSYVYSEVSDYSIYNIASCLYENNKMNTYDGHQYLYNHILKVVNDNYTEVDYQWSNTVVTTEGVE